MMASNPDVQIFVGGIEQKDVAFIPVPRCYACRHWEQEAEHPAIGRCEQITVEGARQLVHTEASFGCVRWAEQSIESYRPNR